MGRWYKDEYTLPVIFLFTLIGLVTPWQYSFGTATFGKYNAIRWWFGEIRMTSIAELNGFVPVHKAIAIQQGTGVFPAYVFWAVGTVAVIGTGILAASFLVADERIEETITVETVATGLFLTAGVAYLASTVYFATHGIPSTPIPLATVFYLAIAAITYNN